MNEALGVPWQVLVTLLAIKGSNADPKGLEKQQGKREE